MKEKEKEIKEKFNKLKKDNFELNQKIHNFNNKSSTNFYRIDKSNNNQKKIPNPPQYDNISGKKLPYDKSKKKVSGNKIKTLSYSNSTRDIYHDKINYKNISNNYNSNNQYNKKKIYQIPINNINYNQNNKKQKVNNNIFTPPITKGTGSNTNININNYYLNNIFSSIYNNYMTGSNNHINFYSKNNNGITRKFISQRSSSVIASKKGTSKINLLERKNIIKNNNNENNYKTNKKNNKNYVYKSYIPNRKINKVNENFIKSPSNNDNYVNKIKSNSVNEQNESFRYGK